MNPLTLKIISSPQTICTRFSDIERKTLFRTLSQGTKHPMAAPDFEKFQDLQRLEPEAFLPISITSKRPVLTAYKLENCFKPPKITASGDFEAQALQDINLILLGIASWLGTDIGKSPESYGSTKEIMAVTPSKKATPSPSQSTAPLDYHVDKVTGSPQPDYVVLACIHGDPDVKTGVIPNSAILNKLSKETIDLLKRPIYINSYDSVGPKPIIEERDDGTLCLCWFESMSRFQTENPQGKQALNAVEAAIRDCKQSHSHSYALKAGEILIIRNGTGPEENPGVVHCREGAIKDKRRRLHRLYINETV